MKGNNDLKPIFDVIALRWKARTDPEASAIWNEGVARSQRRSRRLYFGILYAFSIFFFGTFAFALFRDYVLPHF